LAAPPQSPSARSWGLRAVSGTFSLSIWLKTALHHFDAVAWLCMKVSSGKFRADVVINGLFPAQNSSDNGERVRSLLCSREALGKPPGAAEIS